MKKIITIVVCVFVVGLVGCAKQKEPGKYAERDYNIATAGERPTCPGIPGKLGSECPTADTYK